LGQNPLLISFKFENEYCPNLPFLKAEYGIFAISEQLRHAGGEIFYIFGSPRPTLNAAASKAISPQCWSDSRGDQVQVLR
jgi:hypothetical protein